jgi:hypothetical protein
MVDFLVIADQYFSVSNEIAFLDFETAIAVLDFEAAIALDEGVTSS